MPITNPVMICSKAGDCQQLATHVLIYINATTFRPILDKPKHYCYKHVLLMQTFMRAHSGIQSRIMSVDEYMRQYAIPYQVERDRNDRR